MRLNRYDYAGRIELGDALHDPAPGHAPAVITPDGYLLVDAYLARDGLLRYSDGKDDWIEYRPRAELETAAGSWAHTPITDDHPAKMVTPKTWTEVARGIHVGPGEVVGPLQDGNSYLRAKILITDEAMISEVRSPDGRRELSIGFTSEVRPCPQGSAEDGTRCDAVQTALLGNHTALVDRGRAGPAARILMDGAAVLVTDDMKLPKNVPPKKADKTDEMGAPTESASVVGPDGVEVQLPTWVVAMLEELQAMKAAAATPAPAPAAPPADAAAAPAPAAPPAAPEEEEEDSMKEKSLDALERKLRRRARFERKAATAGLSDAEIDAIEDDDELARRYVLTKIPTAPVKDVRGDALDALVATAASLPEPEPEPEPAAPRIDRHPWDREVPKRRDDSGDVDENDPEVLFLLKQGYGA